MAETSGFYSSTAGDRKYTSTQMSEALESFVQGATGVVRGFLNTLALTSTGGGSGQVNTGRAIHLGRWYKNTAAVAKVLTAVTINNRRRDRFVIRFDPVTARSGVVTVIDGVETVGTPASPAIAATDVLLGYIESYNNGGVYEYSAVDERVYAFDNWVTNAMMTDDSVDTAELVASGVTTAKIADANVTTIKIADSNVTTAKIADSNVTTPKIADSNVTTPKIADDNVTNPKLANIAQYVTKGRVTAGSGDPEDLTPAQLTTVLDQTADWVSDAELANMAQATVKGRANGAGTGDPQNLSVSDLLNIISTGNSAYTLTQPSSAVSTTLTLPSGGSGTFRLYVANVQNSGGGTINVTFKSPAQNCFVIYAASSESGLGELNSPSVDMVSTNDANMSTSSTGPGDYAKFRAFVFYL